MQRFDLFLSDILPLMARINKQPSIPDIQKLNELIEKSSDVFTGRIHGRMLLPLLSQVDSEEIRKKPEIQRHLIRSIQVLLQRITVDTVDCFRTVVIVLLKQIYDFQRASLIRTSEELKSDILCCLTTLSQKSSKDVIEEFFDVKNRQIVANVLFASVQIIEQEAFAGLKIEAINCILSFLQIHDEADKDDIVLRSQIADVIYILLPRMLKALIETAFGDSIRGHQVIAVSIKAVGRIICLILEDYERDLEERTINLEDFRRMILEDDKITMQKDILKIPLSGNADGEILRKNLEWISAFCKKLKPHLSKMLILTQHDHVNVRREVFTACENFLKKCAKNMLECLQSLLQVVFVMTFDEDQTLGKRSSDLVGSLKNHPTRDCFVQEVEAIINSVLMTLPQSILRDDNFKQFLGFSLLQSSLDFIPSNDILTLIMDELFLEKLTTVLILGAELDNKQEDLLTGRGDKFPWRRKRWLTEKKCQKSFDKFCSALNKVEVIGIIASHLLKRLEMRSSTSNQVLIILNNLLKNEGNQQSWMLEFLLELLKDIHWNLAVDSEENLTIEDIKFNIIHSCLILDSIGHCCQRMGSTFQPYLFKTFHRVFAKAGSSNSCVKTAAQMALDNMKESFGATSIEEFVNMNADYIVFYVNKFLRKSHTYDDGLGMLQIILEFSSGDSSTIFYLETILSALLQDTAKIKDQQRLNSHFKIFQLFLLKQSKWSEGNTSEICEETSEKILQQWLDILNHKDEVNEIDETNETEIEGREEEEGEEKPEKPEIPSHIKLTEDILRLVIKHISTKDQDMSLLSLELMTIGIAVLSQCEEKLLPVVHLTWFPLSEKFKCGNPVILRQCFKLLLILARTSKDFILKRSMSDVIPTINQYLIDSSKNSAKNSHNGMYIYTQEFKVIHTILSQYGQLISDIQMSEKNLDTAINCALIYLERDQHPELNKVALEFCRSLMNYDAPTIYLKLLNYPKFLDKLMIK